MRKTHETRKSFFERSFQGVNLVNLTLLAPTESPSISEGKSVWPVNERSRVRFPLFHARVKLSIPSFLVIKDVVTNVTRGA